MENLTIEMSLFEGFLVPIVQVSKYAIGDFRESHFTRVSKMYYVSTYIYHVCNGRYLVVYQHW